MAANEDNQGDSANKQDWGSLFSTTHLGSPINKEGNEFRTSSNNDDMNHRSISRLQDYQKFN